MNVVVRCHIKNNARLDIFKRCINSFLEKELKNFHVLDDGSFLQEQVINLCTEFNLHYKRSSGNPSTINGLVESFNVFDLQNPILCCCDDIVLGKGIKNILSYIESVEIPNLFKDSWATIGLFACYPRNTQIHRFRNTLLWQLASKSLYALTCHVFSPQVQKMASEEWRKILNFENPLPNCCDDIFINRLATQNNMLVLNTLQDYAYHIGAGERTFGEGDAGNSNYNTPCFVGE